MYLPRSQIAQLYTHLKDTTVPTSPSVVILTSLTVDSLCATRILMSLLKPDFIPFTIIPISGYADLQKTGAERILPLTRQRGGEGGTVVCLGLGGAVALEEVLGLDESLEDVAEQGHGVEIWVIDAHRPWNLDNVYGTSAVAPHEDGTVARRAGVREGRISPGYRPGKGGVIVWEDGDLEVELQAQKEAYLALQGMPEITEDDLALVEEDDGDEQEQETQEDGADDSSSPGQKRKRRVDTDDEDGESDSEGEHDRARRRRRSNSSTSVPIPSSPGGNPLSAQMDIGSTPPVMPSSPPKKKDPSARQMRKQLLKLRRRHEATLDKYYSLGTSSAEPVSSMMYSLASELGHSDNEHLWWAIVGVSSLQMIPGNGGLKINHIRELLQDDVRRLNPIPAAELQKSQNTEPIIPTTARGATDYSINLSPEPRFTMIRHWSLWDSMRHSPYLATRLRLWNEEGVKRLKKLLAKMGVSLTEARKGFLHMDSELKRTLRKRILKFASQYNLDGLVPGDDGRRGIQGWSFVRHWGWRGTLSAEDVAMVVGAILEVGTDSSLFPDMKFDHRSHLSYNARMKNLLTPPHSSDDGMDDDGPASDIPDYITTRFWRAFDALDQGRGLETLQASIPSAQRLYQAILTVGSQIISKNLIRHLRSFRMAVVKEGPMVQMFTHPGALVRLAAWVGEAISVIEAEKGKRLKAGRDDALVLGALDDGRGVYIVVGLGGGNGWHGPGKKFRSKAEIREREETKKRKAADRIARKAVERRKREDRRRLRKERNAANGLMDSDEESELETEEDDDDDSDPSDSDSDLDGDDEGDESLSNKPSRRRGAPLNRFGQAFQEVVEETGARVRIDSFEHSVVEVKKEDLAGFLEALSLKAVVG